MLVNNRKEEEKAFRRERILQGALEVMDKSEVNKVTMEHIALQSGFGKATLYYYFKSKDDVIVAILEKGWIQLLETIKAVPVEPSPSQHFMAIWRALVDVVRNEHLLYSFLFRAPKLIAVDSSKNDHWKKCQKELYATLKELLKKGISAGELVNLDPQLLMRAIGGLFHSLLLENPKLDTLQNVQLDQLLKNVLQPT